MILIVLGQEQSDIRWRSFNRSASGLQAFLNNQWFNQSTTKIFSTNEIRLLDEEKIGRGTTCEDSSPKE